MTSTYSVQCPHFHRDVTGPGVAEIRIGGELPVLAPCDACRVALPALLGITVMAIVLAWLWRRPEA